MRCGTGKAIAAICGLLTMLLPGVSGCGGDAQWEPVPPHVEKSGNYTIVWLAGSAYDMGYQQGRMLHDEIAVAVDTLKGLCFLGICAYDIIPTLAGITGLSSIVSTYSYPDILEECAGIADAAEDIGFTRELCLLLNTGDTAINFLRYGKPKPGCTQVFTAHSASTDGRMYHGRSMDWSMIPYLIDFPVIFIRQPNDGIPHMFIGFPGNLSPYQGMNAAGLSMASDQALPGSRKVEAIDGRSPVQTLGQLLKRAHSLSEAQDMVLSTVHSTTDILAVGDGNARTAAVFELTAHVVGVRTMEDGYVFTTNHYVAPETKGLDRKKEPGASSLLRFDRLKQLVPPEGVDTLYGRFDNAVMIDGVLRDTTNPYTGEVYPPEFDNGGKSIATNGAIYQAVFDPETLRVWVAAGGIPVPEQPFDCFSLGELLKLKNSAPCTPPAYP